MPALFRFAQLLALLTVMFVLAGCGGGGSSDSGTTFTVEGRVLNGVLVGSTVDVFGATGGGVLGTATTDSEGRYTAEVSRDGPYRLRATGGKLNGSDYTGTLESTCPSGSGCFVTPYTTILQRLVDDHGFNHGDATALMATSLGFDGDPFAQDVPVEDFDLGAAREAIAGGEGLVTWVGSIVAWATGEEVEPPPGIADPEPPAPPVDPDPVPPPAPDPDPDPVPDPVPDPDPDPVVPVTHTVSATAGTGGSITPASQTIEQGATAMFEVTSQTGYRIDAVSGCSGSLDDTTYITGAITGACTVSATFALIEYTLSYSAGPNGAIEGETVQTVSYGASGAAVTAVPDAGYSFVEWSDTSTANPRTESNVTRDLSITASFALNTYTVTVEGQVVNGVLIGSTLEVVSASGGGVLGIATTDANGRYTVQVSQDGPYRLRATGGKLNGVDYTGILEAACAGGSSCFVTPYTTVLLRLIEDYGFNMGDGAALLANSLGFDGDPFVEDVPLEDFDLDAARQAIAGGDGLSAWVIGVVEWAIGETTETPPGVSEPDPAPVASLLLFGGEDNSVYLGCLTCNALDSESVCNSFGTYGSPFSSASIWNQFGTYGSPFATYSPWNAFSFSGPAIEGTDGLFYGYFTVNTSRVNRTTIQIFVDILNFYSTSNDLSATRSYACGN